MNRSDESIITYCAKVIIPPYHLLTLLHRNTSVQTTKSPIILPTHPANQVQCLSVVGNDDNLIISISGFAHFSHEPIENKHLSRKLWHDRCIASTAHGFIRHELRNTISSWCSSALLFFSVAYSFGRSPTSTSTVKF